MSGHSHNPSLCRNGACVATSPARRHDLEAPIDRKVKRFDGETPRGFAYLSMQQAIADAGLTAEENQPSAVLA